MSEESFYVRLDSGNEASKELWDENSPTVFRNLLANPLCLPSSSTHEWMVALADIIIPNCFYNIDEDMLDIRYQVGPIEDAHSRGIAIQKKLYIPIGFYDPYTFAKVLNLAFARERAGVYKELKSEATELWKLMMKDKTQVQSKRRRRRRRRRRGGGGGGGSC